MDPRIALQGDIPVRHPLELARQRGEVTEAREERAAERERIARREQAEANLAQRAALDRIQLAERGFTDSELAHWQAGQDAAKREQIETLEAELTKLDPQRAAVKRAETVRAAQAAEDDQLLAEARRSASDPFMRDQVRRLSQRQGREVYRSRPFASRSLGDGNFDVPDCAECIKAGATAEESILIHSDPQAPAPASGSSQLGMDGKVYPSRQAATAYREISR